MKTKFFAIVYLGILIAISCEKDKTIESKAELTPQVLEDVSDKTTEIFGDLQTFMFDALTKAIESGGIITTPPSQSYVQEKFFRTLNLKSTNDDFDWYGPDASGWYYKTWVSLGYTYTEKIRCQDTVLTHIYSIEYSGGDGSFSSVYETQYAKYKRGNVTLWKGYSDWKENTFGDNNISDVQWRFEFNDWNPQTGAGIYDWYWGANSLGGNYEPYRRFLNVIALEKGSDLLHIKVTWYDGSVEVGSYEYDTYWEPVDMPEMPCEQ